MTATQTKERPILFSTPMVRAILAGTKTVTRRVMKPQPSEGWQHTGKLIEIHDMSKENPLDHVMGLGFCNADGDEGYACPYGKPGENLWIKESWCHWDADRREPAACWYRTDTLPSDFPLRWKGPRYMPRWASRLTLEITGIRVERVQAIDKLDALAEGIEGERVIRGTMNTSDGKVRTGEWIDGTARDGFRNAWDAINGRRPGCAWRDNAWVWVVEFRRVEGN